MTKSYTIDLTNDSDDDIQEVLFTSSNPISQVIIPGNQNQTVNSRFKRHKPTGSSRAHQQNRPRDDTDIIVVDSSSSDIEEVLTRPSKRPRLAEVIDSDDDYCALHAALDLDTVQNWKVTHGAQINKVDPVAVNELWMDSFTMPPLTVPYTNITTHVRESKQFRDFFIWDKLKTFDTFSHHNEQRHRGGVLCRQDVRSTLQKDVHLNNLKQYQSFSHSPGSINTIQQKEGWVAVGSGVIGGLPDHIDRLENPNPYNRPGSLIAWNSSVAYDPSQCILKGHFLKLGQANNLSDYKNYVIHDIKFDPCNDAFVTTAADFSLKVWEYEENGFPPGYDGFKLDSFKRSRCLHDLAFKPGTSILAVAERRLHVYGNILDNPKVTSFVVTEDNRQSVGAIAWGSNVSDGLIFASTEPLEGSGSIGDHKAFDVIQGHTAYCFDAHEAGDSLAMNSSGSTLCLTTRSDQERKNWLRLYDVRRQDPRAWRAIDLEKFSGDWRVKSTPRHSVQTTYT